MDEIRKDMLEEDDEENGDYMDRLREVSGSGLVNTRISDRESEVCVSPSNESIILFNLYLLHVAFLVSITEAATSPLSK